MVVTAVGAEPIDTSIVARLRAFSLATGMFACAVGLLVLTGWWAGSLALQSVFLGPITVKANTALAIALSGLALLLLHGRPGAGRRAAASAIGVLVALTGGLTLLQHVSGWDLGIDELLFREPPGSPATTRPNRMGPPASVGFTLLGLAILGQAAASRPARRASKGLALLVGLQSVLALTGYLLGQPSLFGVARYTGIALATALTLLALAAGLTAVRPEEGFTRVLCRGDAAGALARRLTMATVPLPLLIGWLTQLGQRGGWYDAGFGTSLVVLGFVVASSVLTWRNAAAVGRAEDERTRAAAAEAVLSGRIATLLDSERAARLEAERANRLKDEFLATLSHELRTPLNSIVGWSHILRSGMRDDRTVARAADVIGRSAETQARLVEDLLDVSRIMTGQLRLAVAPVPLAPVLQAALDTVRPSAEAKGITVRTAVEAEAGSVPGDAERLQQAVWNILANAIKFTPAGGHVAVRLEAAGPNARIVVSDDGPGIDPSFLPHVFDRFRQADSSSTRAHSGLGLGLAIVRHLVELHGGAVAAANNTDGPGAVFTITLPGRQFPAAHALPAPAEAAPPPSLRGVRVLVVDDSADTQELVAELLRRGGAEVVTAASAHEGLDLLARDRPHVVLADIGMPEEDGYGFIRRLREQGVQRGGGTPAIAITAYASSAERVRALMAGFDLHIAKPLPPTEVLAAVARLARRQHGPTADVEKPAD